MQTHPKGAQMKKKITQLLCPVSIANKEYSAEDCRREQWVMLLSDVPLCCCCLSLQVVSYHACVCGLFHSYVLYTLCLCPLNCRLSVVFVCAVMCGLIFFAFLLPTVFIRVAPYPTGLDLGKQTHRNCNLERFCLEKHVFFLK